MTYRDSHYTAFLTTTPMYDNEHQQILEQQLQQQQQQQQHQQEQDQLQLHGHHDSQQHQYLGQQPQMYHSSPVPQQQQQECTPTPSLQHYRHTNAANCSQNQDDNQSLSSNSTEPQHSPSSMQLQMKQEQQCRQPQPYPVKIEENPFFVSSDNLMKDDTIDNNRCNEFPDDFDFTLHPAFPQYMTNGRAKALSLPSSTSITNEYQQNNFNYRELPSNTEYLGDEVAPFATTTDAATVINYNQLEGDLPILAHDVDGNQFQQQSFIGNGAMVFNGGAQNGFESNMVNNGIQEQEFARVSPNTPLGSPLTVQTTPTSSKVTSQNNGNFVSNLAGVNSCNQQGDLSSNGSLDEESNNSFQAHTPTGNEFNMSTSSVSSASALSATQHNGIATITKARLQNFTINRSNSVSPSLSPLNNESRQLSATPSALPPSLSSRAQSTTRQKRRKLPAGNSKDIKQEGDSTTSTLNSFRSTQDAPQTVPSPGNTYTLAINTIPPPPPPPPATSTTITASSASLLRRGHIGRPRVKSAHNVIEQRYRNKINNKFNALQESVPTLKVLLLRKIQEKQRQLLQRQNGDLDVSSCNGAASAAAAGDESLSDNDDINNFDGMDLLILDDKEIEQIDLEGLEPARKLNKGTILAKSIEYIKFLESKNDKLKQDNEALLEKAKMLGVDFDEEEVKESKME